jgi:hypothetical protein
MADGTGQQSGIKVDLPSGGPFRQYGGVISICSVLFALLEIGQKSPEQFIRLLAEYGPKYLLWAGISFMGYDLLKRLIRAFSKSADKIADKIGSMADGMNKMASATDCLANKNDRQAEEMRRLCSFSASQSERAVDIAAETHKVSTRTYEIVTALSGKLGVAPPPTTQSIAPQEEGGQS